MKCVSCKVLKVRSELAGEVACGTHVVSVSVLLLSGIETSEPKMPLEKVGRISRSVTQGRRRHDDNSKIPCHFQQIFHGN